MFTSRGIIKNLSPNKLGVYWLATFLIEDRLVYVRDTPTELLALLSARSSTGVYMDWRVRYEIENCR